MLIIGRKLPCVMQIKLLLISKCLQNIIFLVSKNFYKDSKQCANIKMQFRKKFIFIPHGISWSREPRLFQCVSPESKIFTFLRSYRNYHISHEIKVFHIGIKFLHIVLHQGNIFCFVSYENQIVTITVMTLIKASLNLMDLEYG